MRVKAKKPLGLEDEEAAGFLEEPVSTLDVPVPYRLVAPAPALQPPPPVVVAANARVRQKPSLQPPPLDLVAFPWPMAPTAFLPPTNDLLPVLAATAHPAPLPPPAPRPAAALPPPPPARPTRKRKQTSMGDGMLPPDAIFAPFSKAKRGAAQQAGKGQPQQQEAAGSAAYRLVAPLAQPPLVPAVVVAAPADIVHLARQQEEEERRRAAADATVVVRVLPASQPQGARGAKAGGSKNGKQEKGERAGVGRQRPPRPSRRATPEPGAGGATSSSGQQGLWHPGMESHDGISYVDTLQSVAAQPPPAVVVGTPPRWQQVPVRQPGIQEYSEDPVLASIEFAKQMARTAGRQPMYAGPLQQAINAEQRLYKERLQRALYARDGRRLQAAPVAGTRRSTRTRQATQVFLPTTSQQETARRLKVVVTADPADQTSTRMGADFQAHLPELRQRTAAPTPEEAHWLGELVMDPHAPDLPQLPLDELAAMAAAGDAERAAWVESNQRQLAAAVGSLAAISLGLETMGACVGGSWTEEEEVAFEEGMRAYGRDFHIVQQDYVPSRSVADLVDYYYNVWKLRATPAAVAWYAEKTQAAAEAQAEQERQEAAREVEAARKAERQQTAGGRRQLREMLAWIKAAARNPKDANFNKATVRDRAGRAAKLIGSLNAPAATTP